jgi:hypothetical protein
MRYQCSKFKAALATRLTFHFRPMSSFLVARIAQNHAVLIERVEITFLSSVSAHLLCIDFRVGGCPSSGRASLRRGKYEVL